MEGIIRVWNFQNVNQKKDVNKKCCVGAWNNSEDDKLEPIWQLLYNQEQVDIKKFRNFSSQLPLKFLSNATIYYNKEIKLKEFIKNRTYMKINNLQKAMNKFQLLSASIMDFSYQVMSQVIAWLILTYKQQNQ